MTRAAPAVAQMDFGDAIASVVVRDQDAGIELWSVRDRGRLWAAYHETYVFCWAHRVLTDQAWLYRGRRYGATTQTTMLIEPGEVHRTLRSGPAGFYLLWLRPSTVAALLDCHPFHFREGQTSELIVANHFKSMSQLLEGSPGNCLAQEESVLQFLHTLTQVCAEPFPSLKHTHCHRAVSHAREYIHAHYEDNLRLDDLANVAGLSKYHLTRIFQREMGVPIHRYQTLLRMEKGREQLLRGHSVSDVALAVGFFDQSHFHQAFRKAFGMTPRRFCPRSASRQQL